MKQSRRTNVYVWILILAIAGTILLMKTAVSSDALFRNRNTKVRENVTLGDLTINVSQPDTDDKIGVTLQFSALARVRQSRELQLEIGTASSDIRIDEATVLSPSSARISSLSRSSARIVVVGSRSTLGSTSPIEFDSSVAWYRPPASYFNSIQVAPEVRIRYLLDGTVRGSRLIGGWFHWYPFDDEDVRIPIRPKHLAFVREIDLAIPNGFVGTAAVEPSGTEFAERENHLHMSPLIEGERIPVQLGNNLTVNAHFRRSRLTQFILIIVVAIGAAVGGYILGRLAKTPSNTPAAVVISGLGIAGIPTLLRTWVLTHPSGIEPFPYVVTVADIWFLISWLLFAVVAISVVKGK